MSNLTYDVSVKGTPRVKAISLFNYVGEKSTNELIGPFEVTNFTKGGFEYESPIFWKLFESTFCKILGSHIEKKTIKVIWEHLSDDEKAGLNHPLTRRNNLAKFRRNFGKKVIADVFSMETRLFNKHSELMKHVCRNIATAKALDDVYNAYSHFSWDGLKIEPFATTSDFWADLYLNVPSAQATRNRYRFISRYYRKIGGGKTLSIACGSAQPLIHAVNKMANEGHPNFDNVQLVLTDPDVETLDFAMKRAKQAGVDQKVRCIQSAYQHLDEVLSASENFEIIEACGICDYLNDDYFCGFVANAMKFLAPGGTLIISNMISHHALDLLREIYNWEIVGRTVEQFGNLLRKAGVEDARIFVEPWKIHMMAVIKKSIRK